MWAREKRALLHSDSENPQHTEAASDKSALVSLCSSGLLHKVREHCSTFQSCANELNTSKVRGEGGELSRHALVGELCTRRATAAAQPQRGLRR